MKYSLFCFILMLSLSNFAFAQKSQSTLHHVFELDRDSEDEMIEIFVPDNTKKLKFHVNAVCKSGLLNVTILDPDGKKMNHIQLKTNVRKNKVVPNYPGKVTSPSESGSENIQITTKNGLSSNRNSNTNSDTNSKTNTDVSESQNLTGTISSISRQHGGIQHAGQTKFGHGSKGNLNEEIPTPKRGTWQVLIETKEVDAFVEVSIMHHK